MLWNSVILLIGFNWVPLCMPFNYHDLIISNDAHVAHWIYCCLVINIGDHFSKVYKLLDEYQWVISCIVLRMSLLRGPKLGLMKNWIVVSRPILILHFWRLVKCKVQRHALLSNLAESTKLDSLHWSRFVTRISRKNKNLYYWIHLALFTWVICITRVSLKRTILSSSRRLDINSEVQLHLSDESQTERNAPVTIHLCSKCCWIFECNQ